MGHKTTIDTDSRRHRHRKLIDPVIFWRPRPYRDNKWHGLSFSTFESNGVMIEENSLVLRIYTCSYQDKISTIGTARLRQEKTHAIILDYDYDLVSYWV